MAHQEIVPGLVGSERISRPLTRSSSLAIPNVSRRYDIDTLRVLALGLLIVFHTLLVFEPFGWRVTSIHAGRWADLAAATLTPWRLEVIFAIGGIAAAFLLRKETISGFLRTRALRLLVPFFIGVIFLVPPQSYVHLLAQGRETMSFWEFWSRGLWINLHHGIPVPDLAHVWFLPYLFFYSALLVTLLAMNPTALDRAKDEIAGHSILTIVALSMAWYALVQSMPFPDSGLAKMPLGDIPAHFLYAPAFFFGFLISDNDAFWNSLVEERRVLLVTSCVAAVVSLASLRVSQVHPSSLATLAVGLSRGLFGGVMAFAVFSWGRWAFSKPARGLAYATDAILPVYLMHQTVLVVGAYELSVTSWPVSIALPSLIVMSFGVPLLVYHLIIRRVPFLRFLFGVKALTRDPSPAAQQA
jgi:glucan biosynthesis protein C